MVINILFFFSMIKFFLYLDIKVKFWGLDISNDGVNLLLLSSKDRSNRIWERSQEQIFISEEREQELEKLFEESLEDSQPSLEEGARESAIATTQNLASIRASEALIEAIEEAEKDKMKWVEYENTLLSLQDMTYIKSIFFLFR